MIFNCLGCGISISTKREKCLYCKCDNTDAIESLTGLHTNRISTPQKAEWREKMKGTILSLVHR